MHAGGAPCLQRMSACSSRVNDEEKRASSPYAHVQHRGTAQCSTCLPACPPAPHTRPPCPQLSLASGELHLWDLGPSPSELRLPILPCASFAPGMPRPAPSRYVVRACLGGLDERFVLTGSEEAKVGGALEHFAPLPERGGGLAPDRAARRCRACSGGCMIALRGWELACAFLARIWAAVRGAFRVMLCKWVSREVPCGRSWRPLQTAKLPAPRRTAVPLPPPEWPAAGGAGGPHRHRQRCERGRRVQGERGCHVHVCKAVQGIL